MKHMHSFHQSNVSKHVDIAHINHIFRESFSEHEIIAVNDLLLSNGFHAITVKNRRVGRRIIETFLSLLNYYKQIAWLTIDNKPPADMIDLAKTLQEKLLYASVNPIIRSELQSNLHPCPESRESAYRRRGARTDLYDGVDAFVAFLCEDFFADFLIIECSDQLLTKTWYAQFEHAMYELCLQETMPIVHIIYQK